MRNYFRFLFILIASLLFIVNHSTAQVTFHKSYSNFMASVYPKGIINTSDAGFLIFSDYVSGPNEQSALLIKTTANGDTLWTQILRNTNANLYTVITSAIELPNSQGYILIGHYLDALNSTAPSGALLFRLDVNGNLQLTKQFECNTPQGLNWFKSGCLSYDGNLLLLGIVGTYLTSYSSVLMKITPAGIIVWTKSISGFSEWDENPQSILELADHSIVIVRDTLVQSVSRNIEIMKFDSNGSQIWAKYYSSAIPQHVPVSMTLGDNNSMLIAGYMVSTSNQFKGFMMSVDSVGTLIWYREYGDWTNNNLYLKKAYPLSNGNFVAITGTGDEIILFITDANGIVLSTKGIQSGNGTSNFWVNDFVISNDGGYVIAGSDGENGHIIKTYASGIMECDTFSYSLVSNAGNINTTVSNSFMANISFPEIVPVFMQSQGLDVNVLCITSGINDVNNLENSIAVYPNPVVDNLTVNSNSNILSEIILYDIDSRKVLHQKFTNSINLNTNQLSNGIYFYEVLCGGSTCKKGKLVKF